MKVEKVQEAPVFNPTAEEWQDAIAYIEKIRPEAEKYGICKIRPPSCYQPPLAIDKDAFRFQTRVQDLREIDAVARAERRFNVSLRLFLFKEGTSLPLKVEFNLPKTKKVFEILDSRTKDDVYEEFTLYKLSLAYQSTGGFKKSSEVHFWLKVAKRLFNCSINEKLTIDIKQVFDKYLFGFLNKSLKVNYRSDISTAIKAKEISKAVTNRTRNLRYKLYYDPIFTKPKGEAVIELIRGKTFWKYFPEKQACYKGQLWDRSNNDSFTIHYDLSDVSRPIKRLKGVKENYTSNAFHEVLDIEDLKLYMKTGTSPKEAYNAYINGICQECSYALSNTTSVTCYNCESSRHYYCLQPPLLLKPDHVWFCEDCLNTESNDYLQLLSSFGYDEGEEFSINEFETVGEMFLRKFYIENSGWLKKPTTHKEFEDIYWRVVSKEARNSKSKIITESFKINYGSDLDTKLLGSAFPTKVYIDKLQQRKKKLTTIAKTMKDEDYRDISNTIKELAIEIKRSIEYVEHPWNLNNFPTAEGSLLQHVDSSITGVMVPWLYIGMAFSSFCFHTEDHNFASINYHHFGEPKSWYGVPSNNAELFERTCKRVCPDMFKARKDILNGIVTQFNPEELITASASKLKMYHVLQEPGDYVITFPRAYHGGFNHGFNCAEAVNFATFKWLPYARECVNRYREIKKAPVIAYDLFLCSLSKFVTETSGTNAYCGYNDVCWLRMELVEVREAEETKRKIVISKTSLTPVDANTSDTQYEAISVNTEKAKANTMKKKIAGRERATMVSRMGGNVHYVEGINQCTTCLAYCSFSFCYNIKTKQAYCLDHVLQVLTPEKKDSFHLVYKVSIDELNILIDKLVKLSDNHTDTDGCR